MHRWMKQSLAYSLLTLVFLATLIACGDGSSNGGDGFIPVEETVSISSRIEFASNPDRIVLLDPEETQSDGELFLCQISFGDDAELEYSLAGDGKTLTLGNQELTLSGELELDVSPVAGVPNGIFKRWSFPPVLIEGVRNVVEVAITDELISFQNTCTQ